MVTGKKGENVGAGGHPMWGSVDIAFRLLLLLTRHGPGDPLLHFPCLHDNLKAVFWWTMLSRVSLHHRPALIGEQGWRVRVRTKMKTSGKPPTAQPSCMPTDSPPKGQWGHNGDWGETISIDAQFSQTRHPWTFTGSAAPTIAAQAAWGRSLSVFLMAIPAASMRLANSRIHISGQKRDTVFLLNNLAS